VYVLAAEGGATLLFRDAINVSLRLKLESEADESKFVPVELAIEYGWNAIARPTATTVRYAQRKAALVLSRHTGDSVGGGKALPILGILLSCGKVRWFKKNELDLSLQEVGILPGSVLATKKGSSDCTVM
jgi:hypothetical protein